MKEQTWWRFYNLQIHQKRQYWLIKLQRRDKPRHVRRWFGWYFWCRKIDDRLLGNLAKCVRPDSWLIPGSLLYECVYVCELWAYARPFWMIFVPFSGDPVKIMGFENWFLIFRRVCFNSELDKKIICRRLCVCVLLWFRSSQWWWPLAHVGISLFGLCGLSTFSVVQTMTVELEHTLHYDCVSGRLWS